VPLVSVLAMVWLYVETKDVTKVSALATSIFWLVLPSLALFAALPMLLKQGIGFFPSLVFAIGITVFCYLLMAFVLRVYGVQL